MAGKMKAIKDYLRFHHSAVRVPLACIIIKTIVVQIYGDYPTYVTPDDKMVVRMLHLSSDKNKMQNKQNAHSIIKCTRDNQIDNRTVNVILNQICKDIDLYPCVK